MAHTTAEKLKDLHAQLESIRKWIGIKEKSHGVFYIKSTPFLHFHDKDGKRWADVRAGKQWGTPLEIPFDATAKEKEQFLQEVRARYEGMTTKNSQR